MTNPALSPPLPDVFKPTAMGAESNEFVVAIDRSAGLVPGLGGATRQSLLAFDATAWRTLRSNVVDFTIQGSTLYTLEPHPVSSALSPATIPAATAFQAPHAQRIIFSNMPSTAKAIEVWDGVVYIGDTQGQLWAGRLDGTSLGISGTPSIFNELADQFGRSLAFNRESLAVGVPDFSGSNFMCGQVSLWASEAGGSGIPTWRRVAEITPPQPSFSGWFGKDVALENDRLAVVEAGRDTSRADRGSSA